MPGKLNAAACLLYEEIQSSLLPRFVLEIETCAGCKGAAMGAGHFLGAAQIRPGAHTWGCGEGMHCYTPVSLPKSKWKGGKGEVNQGFPKY